MVAHHQLLIATGRATNIAAVIIRHFFAVRLDLVVFHKVICSTYFGRVNHGLKSKTLGGTPGVCLSAMSEKLDLCDAPGIY
jgi:hypothetical protein